MNKIYRTDIDGLMAIALVSVILFHLGYIDNGYLGVDVFFVISGYLITGIVYREVKNDKFSVLKFYERRIRRKLRMLNNSQDIADLRIPPSNRLEKLTGNLKEFYSIIINKQCRIIFICNNGNASNVEIIDYH